MKDFSGTIIITDPMYVSKSDDWMENKGFNVTKHKVAQGLGIDNYLISESGVGSINMTLHKIENIKEFFQDQKEYIKNCLEKAYSGDIKPVLGNISSDSGLLGIFYKSEVEAYNPEWEKDHDHVELDFKGRIGSYTDSYGQLHYYGIGNINFYTL